MIFNTPIRTSSVELTRLEREEAEAEELLALRAMLPEPTPEQLDPHLEEIERLAAADLVMLLRHAERTGRERNEIERARIAQAGRRLAAELLDGARKLERYRPSDDVPDYLRSKGLA